jgi:hypothetical protein
MVHHNMLNSHATYRLSLVGANSGPLRAAPRFGVRLVVIITFAASLALWVFIVIAVRLEWGAPGCWFCPPNWANMAPRLGAIADCDCWGWEYAGGACICFMTFKIALKSRPWGWGVGTGGAGGTWDWGCCWRNMLIVLSRSGMTPGWVACGGGIGCACPGTPWMILSKLEMSNPLSPGVDCCGCWVCWGAAGLGFI